MVASEDAALVGMENWPLVFICGELSGSDDWRWQALGPYGDVTWEQVEYDHEIHVPEHRLRYSGPYTAESIDDYMNLNGRRVRSAISKSDAVFAWLPALVSPREFVHIGYAKALEKPVYVFSPKSVSDSLSSLPSLFDFASRWCLDAEDPLSAWEMFSKILPGDLAWTRRLVYASDKARAHLRSRDRRMPRALTKGHVYLIQAGPHFKIGKSAVIDNRIRQLAIQIPYKPVVVHTIRASYMDTAEYYFHALFQPEHTNGEWFLLDPQQVEWFKKQDEWTPDLFIL